MLMAGAKKSYKLIGAEQSVAKAGEVNRHIT